MPRNIRNIQGLVALSPLIVFLCLYLLTSVAVGDFYKMPITVAFLASSVFALAITPGLTARERVDLYSKGASDSNIMLMVWIFVLAGAFAKSAGAMGSIEAMVTLTMHLLPDGLLNAGLFVAACFISLSIGTSVGTIVALVPVAAGISAATGADAAFVTAIVVGGAFFGDNLSFISDTTIAATRTQGCSMSDKFKTNLRIVLPAAIVTLIFYLVGSIGNIPPQITSADIDYIKVIPYILVLVCAVIGMNVSLVLTLGIISVGIVGLSTGSIGGYFGWVEAMGQGIAGMGDLIIITLMAGGMLEVIRHNGGIDFILRSITRHIHGRRGAELSIAALVSIANICTANNTIAIITVGSLSADIASKYGVDPRKSASILDTFSCVVQGMLPYGAQLLMAAGLAGVSPIEIIKYLYYPMAVLVAALIGIAVKNRRRWHVHP